MYAYITNTCSFGYHDSQSDFKDIVEISHMYVIFTWWISQEEIFCITVTHLFLHMHLPVYIGIIWSFKLGMHGLMLFDMVS